MNNIKVDFEKKIKVWQLFKEIVKDFTGEALSTREVSDFMEQKIS
jgi:histone deacetylase complex regulatory component SIN3